jgi:hypothetical protein
MAIVVLGFGLAARTLVGLIGKAAIFGKPFRC